MSIPDASLLNQAAELLVHTDKSKALISLGFSIALSMIIVYILSVLLTDSEAKKIYTTLKRLFIVVTLFFGLFLCARFILKDISYFFQKEPELIISNQGIQFHTLGFLPWDEVYRIEPMHKGRKSSTLFKIVLKSNSPWQPEATSFLSPSTFADKSIVVEKVMDMDLNDLFNSLNRLKPPTTMHE